MIYEKNIRLKTNQTERLQIVREDKRMRLKGALIQPQILVCFFRFSSLLEGCEFLFFATFNRERVENVKEETGEIVALTNPLAVFADLACWQSCCKLILSYSSHCIRSCQDEHNWMVETNTVFRKRSIQHCRQVRSFSASDALAKQFCSKWKWKKHVSVRPGAQMAAQHEWSCMEGRSASASHTGLLLCRFHLFCGKPCSQGKLLMLLNENFFRFGWGSTTGLCTFLVLILLPRGKNS